MYSNSAAAAVYSSMYAKLVAMCRLANFKMQIHTLNDQRNWWGRRRASKRILFNNFKQIVFPFEAEQLMMT